MGKKFAPEDFATPRAPLRGSSLETLMGICEGFVVLRMLGEREEGGIAAHTGTAIGRAIEIVHQKGGKRKAFADIMAQVRKESVEGTPGSDDQASFSKANWTEVEGMLKGYTEDRRNNVRVVEDSLEEVVTLSLPPHPLDPTGEPVYLTGHIDQVRYDMASGSYKVWDVKSGKGTGAEMTSKYKWQVACYTEAYKVKYPDRKVSAGGIINVRDYIENRTIKNPDYDPDAPNLNPKARKSVLNRDYDPDAPKRLIASLKRIPNPNGTSPKTVPNPGYDPGAPKVNPASRKNVPNPEFDPDAEKVNPKSRKTIVLENPGEQARVFYPLPIAKSDYGRLLGEVTRTVALIRSGHTGLNPDGFWCSLCPGERFNRCVGLLKNRKFAV